MTESHWKRRMEISFHLLTFINAAASKHQLKAHYFLAIMLEIVLQIFLKNYDIILSQTQINLKLPKMTFIISLQIKPISRARCWIHPSNYFLF